MTEPRQRRRHPAKASRVAAAGFGMATMLGLVGAMGYAQRASAGAAATAPATVPVVPQAAPQPAPQVVVVIHRRPNPDAAASVPVTTPSTTATTATTATSAPSTPTATTVPAAPIPLTARPVVVAAPTPAPAAAPAPAPAAPAKTHASH